MKKITYVGALTGFDTLNSNKNDLMLIVEINTPNEIGSYHKVLFKTYDIKKDLKTVTKENELNTYFVFKCYETKTKTICYDYWHAFYDYKTCELLNYNYENEHRKR